MGRSMRFFLNKQADAMDIEAVEGEAPGDRLIGVSQQLRSERDEFHKANFPMIPGLYLKVPC